MLPKFFKRFLSDFRGKVKNKREKEKKEALKKVNSNFSNRYQANQAIDAQEKVLREAGGQDITAI